MTTDQYNGLPPGGKTTTGGQPHEFKRKAMSEYTPIQTAAFEQSYYTLAQSFRDAIAKMLKSGKTPQEISKDFLRVASVAPGHREEFALRLEHGAIAVQLGLVDE